MGMYDSVYIYCKNCGYKIEIQSKAGGCNLKRYGIDDKIPKEIINDIINKQIYCENCGKEYIISVEYIIETVLRY